MENLEHLIETKAYQFHEETLLPIYLFKCNIIEDEDSTMCKFTYSDQNIDIVCTKGDFLDCYLDLLNNKIIRGVDLDLHTNSNFKIGDIVYYSPIVTIKNQTYNFSHFNISYLTKAEVIDIKIDKQLTDIIYGSVIKKSYRDKINIENIKDDLLYRVIEVCYLPTIKYNFLGEEFVTDVKKYEFNKIHIIL